MRFGGLIFFFFLGGGEGSYYRNFKVFIYSFIHLFVYFDIITRETV